MEEPADKRDRSSLASCFVVLLVVLFSKWVLTLVVFYAAGAIAAFRSERAAFYFIGLSCLVSVLNPMILAAGASSLVSVGRWACFLLALLHLLRKGVIFRKGNRVFFVGCGLFLFSILFGSYAPIASLAKLIAFALGVFSVVRLAELVMSVELAANFIMGVVSIAVLSALTLAEPSIAFARNETGFQGILSHPQTYGVFTAVAIPLLLLLWSRWGRYRMVVFGTLLFLTLSLPLAESRTAALSAVVSCLLMLVIWLSGSRLSRRQRSLIVFVLMPCLLGVTVLTYPTISAGVEGFLRKRSREAALDEAILSSRAGLVSRGMSGFFERPFTGRGFGLPSDARAFTVKSANLSSLSLASEKGVVYVAVLEESGLMGATGLALILWWVLVPMFRTTRLELGLAVPCSFLLTNFGEAVLFSFGAIGAWGWIAIALAREGSFLELCKDGSE